MPHTPPVHVGVPYIVRGQTLVHEPHAFGSPIVSTHIAEQRVDVGAVQPLAHPYVPPAPIVHAGVGSAQTVPHAPQLDGTVTSASHPSLALALQCARPAAQLTERSHTPATHCARAASTPGSTVQSFSHAPQ